MALTYSHPQALGSHASPFRLRGVDGRFYTLSDFQEARALVLIFMCNHCPYVIAVQDRINALAKTYASRGVSVVGINSNDSVKYPADSFEAMKLRAEEQRYAFVYLHDETQEVAKAYGAVCTPDPYLFENVNGSFLLRYQGRIDDHWKDESAVTKRDLADAIDSVLSGRPVVGEQVPSMGCSIKWKV